MTLITLEEFEKNYSDLIYPAAMDYLYEVAAMKKGMENKEELKIYRNVTSIGNNLFNMVLWIGKEKDSLGNIAAGGLFNEKYFIQSIKIVAKFNHKKPKNPIHIAGKTSLNWEELVDYMHENIKNREPL